MKNKMQSKYSYSFYHKILNRLTAAVAIFSFILFAIFGIRTYTGNVRNTNKELETGNRDSYEKFIDIIENCMRICQFFSTYDNISPAFQLQTDINIYKSILSKEIKSFVSCFDYIAKIEINTGEFDVSYGLSANKSFTPLQSYKGFDINYLAESKWPQYLQIEYIDPGANSFRVKINIYASNIGRTCFDKNTVFSASDGTILIAQDAKLLGKNLTELYKIDMADLFSKSPPAKYTRVLRNFNNGKAKIITLYPSNQIRSEAFAQITPILLMFFLTTSVITLLLFVLVRRIYSPIDKVVQVLKYYLPDDKNIAEEDVNFITKCIPYKNLDDATKAAVIQIRKSQLYTLHSQISPHFLGNSLEVLKWEIIRLLGADTPIEQALSTMSLFLADAQEYKKMIVTIAEEIKHTQQYVKMITFCFNEKLQVEWEVDEEVKHYAIISLTLQPIIENAVIHGFHNCSHVPKIKINIKIKNQIIEITVADNGNGMEPETLQNILQSLSDEEYSQHHIGLKNTHLKFQYLYGNAYGITQIKSNASGTVTKISYPAYPLQAET